MASTKTEVTTLPPQKYGRVVLTLDNVLLPLEKLNNSPSAADGLDPQIEYDLRVLGCEMIQTSGILLRLPQVAMACGQVLFQRLYYAKSLVRYPMEATAMACVALGSKIEEAPRKIRDVINVFKHIRQVRNGKTLSPVILDANYITLKNQVIKAERRLLKELGFCCHVKHPHKMIIMYLRLVEADDNRNLAKTSWNYMNDALRTDVFMRYTPESIACACIWLAARQLKVPLPENPPWYHIVSIVLEDIQLISAAVLKLYTRPKVKLEVLEAKVEDIRKQQQDAKLRNKALPLHQQTPLQPTISTFSPSSRTVSPHGSSTQGGKAISHQNKRKTAHHGHHHRSGSETSRSSGSRASRSGASPHRSHKRGRRSDSRDRSRSRSNDRHRSRSRSNDRHRSRERSRDRHSRKSRSKSISPNITPPPLFTKNKEKGPIVQSVSRSRSRSPLRTYDKYERQDKYNKYERRDKYSEKNNSKYASDKYENYDKIDRYDKYERNDKYVEKADKYNNYDKNNKYNDKYDKNDSYYKEDKHIKEDKLVKYDFVSKEKTIKYEKLGKYDKVEKYTKYDKIDKKRSHDSKKIYDNGYEKVHKSKKSSRHRSRSRDRRR